MKIDSLYYFAHPYTVKDTRGNLMLEGANANFNLCAQRSAELLKRGINIYSPITHTHPIHVADPEFLGNEEYELWLKMDKLFMKKTEFNGIILAPRWESSTGCRRERKWFEEDGNKEIHLYEDIVRAMPIIYNTPEFHKSLRDNH